MTGGEALSFDEPGAGVAADPALVEDGVRAFALGEEAFRPAARLAGLERMGERLARHIREIVEPFARAKVQVGCEPIVTVRFEHWRGELPAFTSLSLYRLRPLKGGMLIAMEPEFVARLVDAFYGGSGKACRSKAKEFTPTEDRLVMRVTDAVVERLAETWKEVATVTPLLAGRETNAAYATLARPDEAIVVQRFAITPGIGKPSTLTVVYPLASLRPFEAALAAKVHDDSHGADDEWRARLADALQGVRLPVRSVLARPELSVAQLLALKPGDVIPITLAARAPLLVSNRKFATGTIGERDGRAALMVEEVGSQEA